ncbi:LPXTG cell wall anchor domain-containing protein [Actinokineospora xionganensis]|uniref:LPXTG cell wall anchor domain-containing protein n=1 Tax=Actinokineospora xionganensis TaxID=2684470 RepID=A0ABR7L2P5_9PSEU|nr:SdrD B-like domain-containing protein [Actinokineospora xionganensis]MBC6446949.1 LPXTG cell wall anchor domain-containing protein [Actinokineospora xionganensis]
MSLFRHARVTAAACAVAAGMLVTAPAHAQPVEPDPAPSSVSAEPSAPVSEPAPEPSSAAPSAPAESVAPPQQKPADQADANPVQPFAVEVTLDKTSYQTGEPIKGTLKITNTTAGPLKASAYPIAPESTITLHYQSRSKIEAGVQLDAGQSHTHELEGVVGDPNATTAVLTGWVQSGDFSHRSTSFTMTAALKQVHGKIAGVVYLDKNGNEKIDAGEVAADATVTADNSLVQNGRLTVKTDAEGRFTFDRLAPVPHSVFPEVGDWTFRYTAVQVDLSDGNMDLKLRGVRPFNEGLTASVKFKQDSYKPGGTAELVVTLTNTGTVPMVGINVACNRSGEGPGLQGTGPGWGDFPWDRKGVSIAPGKTETFEVSEIIPVAYGDYGVVVAECDFGWDGRNNAEAGDSARLITDATGTVRTVAFQDGNGNGWSDEGETIEGVDVQLVDPDTAKVVASARTNGKGVAEFKDTPAGIYLADVNGPWTVFNPEGYRVLVKGNGCWYSCDFEVELKPGVDADPTPNPVTTVPTAPPAAPAPQARSGNLPDTGANVVWLSVGGLTTLLAGAVFLIAANRRRAKAN